MKDERRIGRKAHKKTDIHSTFDGKATKNIKARDAPADVARQLCCGFKFGKAKPSRLATAPAFTTATMTFFVGS